MRGTVGAHQARAVQRKHHRQVLQGDIVNQLVVAALQKGRVNRHHRLEAFAGHAGGKGHGVLLGNADVVIAIGKALMKFHHARALAHGRRDADQAFVVHRHVAQPAAEDLREGLLGRCCGFLQAQRRVELAGAVVGHRVGFGQLVTLAFFGHHMQKLRALEMADVLERGDQGLEVVAVDRADVVEAEVLKQRGRHHHALGMRLQAFGQLKQRRRSFEHLLADVLGGGVKLAAHELREVAVQRAHRRADAHVVVVQDDQQLAVADAGVVQRLESHAGAHGTVADDGHGVAVFALLLGRHGHAQSGGNRGGRMRRAEGVVLAFAAPRKARQAAKLAQAVHAVAPPGQDLVRVSLVAHIPDQPVVRRVEDIVQGHGELDRAQVGAEVAAGARHAVEQIGAQLVRHAPQLWARHAPQVGGAVDGVKQLIHPGAPKSRD